MIKRGKAEVARNPFSREKVERECCFDPRKTQMFSSRSSGCGLGPFHVYRQLQADKRALWSQVLAKALRPWHQDFTGVGPLRVQGSQRRHILCLLYKASTSAAFVPLGPLPNPPGCHGRGARPAEWCLGGPNGLGAGFIEHHAAQIFSPRLADVPSLA